MSTPGKADSKLIGLARWLEDRWEVVAACVGAALVVVVPLVITWPAGWKPRHHELPIGSFALGVALVMVGIIGQAIRTRRGSQLQVQIENLGSEIGVLGAIVDRHRADYFDLWGDVLERWHGRGGRLARPGRRFPSRLRVRGRRHGRPANRSAASGSRVG